MNRLHTIYREPFSLGQPQIRALSPGGSLVEIARKVDGLPFDFFDAGTILVNGEVVPREYWDRVRPKADTVVTLHAPISGGGGGGGGKQVFALVAAIALTVVTGGIAAGSLAPFLGTSFAAGTLGASLLAGAISIGGALAIGALTSPPVVAPEESGAGGGGNRLEPAAVSGNLLQPNTPVPRVIGTRRTFPPFLSEPIVELVGQDEFVEAVYGLAGVHSLSDFRLGDGSVELDPVLQKDVEIQTREGHPDDNPLTLTVRQGRTFESQVELSTHQVDPENPDTLIATNPLPVFHAVTTRIAPDENWLHFHLAGLTRQDDSDDPLRIPIRIRMRRRGDAVWRDLPEIHYQNATQSPIKFQVKFYWGDAWVDGLVSPPGSIGFVTAFKVVPAQDVQPIGETFTADSYFSAGSGNDVYEAGTQGTTNVRNILLYSDRVEVYLDEAEWVPGIYDIEVKRGAVFRNALFTTSTYTYDGDILDFFGQIAAGTLPLTRAGLLDNLVMVRLVNIWNEYPINQSNMALIALKAKNRSVRVLSCLASGLVLDQPLGRGPLFEQDSGVDSLWSWDDVGQVQDIEVLALIRPTAVDEDFPESVAVLVRGPEAAEGAQDGYYLNLRPVDDANPGYDGLGLSKIVNGVKTLIAVERFNWTLDRNYFLRLLVNGTSLKGKAWPASLPEPDGWMIEETDGDVTVAGYVGFYWNSTAMSNYANWFSVGLSGQPAPNPPSLSANLATDFSEYAVDQDPSDWQQRFASSSHATITEASFMPYNGQQEDWTELRATSNPAPHLRDILTGTLNFDPLPFEIFDEAGVSLWRQRCAASDFTCDMVVEGLDIADLLRVVSSTGYARLYRSERWGVIQDQSRVNESPVQIFSPRNSNGFAWQKAFPRLPAGFRVNFREEDNEYDTDQIIIYRNNTDGSGQRLEQLTYDGLVRKSDVIRRATFDLRQAEARGTFYSFTAPAESIVCRRGSLIGVNHDILTRHSGSARISDVFIDGGAATGVRLDAPVEIKNEPDILNTADILQVDDVLQIGVQTAVGIRSDDGTISVRALLNSTEESDELEFEDPLPLSLIREGNLVVVGLRGSEYKRLIVSEIVPGRDLEASFVCVDEASEIFDVFGEI